MVSGSQESKLNLAYLRAFLHSHHQHLYHQEGYHQEDLLPGTRSNVRAIRMDEQDSSKHLDLLVLISTELVYPVHCDHSKLVGVADRVRTVSILLKLSRKTTAIRIHVNARNRSLEEVSEAPAHSTSFPKSAPAITPGFLCVNSCSC